MSDGPKNPPQMSQMVPPGLKWLAEMEALDSPALMSVLYGNIYSFPHVKDAELLVDRFGKKMLIWIQFTWPTAKIFQSRKKKLIMNILDQLQELLPSFEFRVIEDRALFDLAVKKAEEYLFGRKKNEPASKPVPQAPSNPSVPVATPASGGSEPEPKSESTEAKPESTSVESDKKEPAQD